MGQKSHYYIKKLAKVNQKMGTQKMGTGQKCLFFIENLKYDDIFKEDNISKK